MREQARPTTVGGRDHEARAHGSGATATAPLRPPGRRRHVRGARFARRGRLALGLLGALATVLLVTVPQATSASWTDPAYVTSAGATGFWLPWYGQVRLNSTTLCLDIPARTDSAGQSLQLYVCNSTPAQIWFFDADKRVRVFVKGQNSPTDGATIRCLQYNGTGQPVTIETCRTGRSSQQWTVTAVNGTFQISSVDTATQCLDVPAGSQTQGTTVVTSNCTGQNRARAWQLEYVATISYA